MLIGLHERRARVCMLARLRERRAEIWGTDTQKSEHVVDGLEASQRCLLHSSGVRQYRHCSETAPHHVVLVEGLEASQRCVLHSRSVRQCRDPRERVLPDTRAC